MIWCFGKVALNGQPKGKLEEKGANISRNTGGEAIRAGIRLYYLNKASFGYAAEPYKQN
jgi:hypothetical protein